MQYVVLLPEPRRTSLTVPFRLYVGSLHFNLTESDIKQVFEPFGELEFVDLHRDPMTGRSKGYAFVQYVYPHCQLVVYIADCSDLLDTRSLRMLRWPWSKWKALSLRVVRYAFSCSNGAVIGH